MHRGPGNQNDALTADGYFVSDLTLNYTKSRYQFGRSIENLTNTKCNEFEADQVTRLKGEPASIDQMSFTPGTPFDAILEITVFF
jgi:hypothetical protein